MDLSAEVAVVTGAGRGIGRVTALKLASLGAAVVVMDINGDNAETTAEEIRQTGRTALSAQVDLTVIPDLRLAVDGVIKEMGAIDILVANVGIGQIKDIFTITEQDWDVMLDTNLKQTFFINQMVLKHMCDRERGAVVNISSVGGRGPNPIMAHYAASKMGVISITQSFAKAVGEYGVRVNAIAPGVIPGDMWREVGAAAYGGDEKKGRELMEAREKTATLRGHETPEDIAEMVAFLVSDRGRFITGQCINVDGGRIFS